MYSFLPPRRSPGLILSLDYSFQMHEKYNATNFSISYLAKTGPHSVSTLAPPPPKTDVSFLLLLPVGDLGVPLLRPRQPRLASRLDRSHKACATCVAHRFRAVAAADIVRRRSSSSWCVSGGSLLATSASCSDGCMPH